MSIPELILLEQVGKCSRLHRELALDLERGLTLDLERELALDLERELALDRRDLVCAADVKRGA
ncbi:MAG: hypothetical protein ABIP29_03970, partial [Candidatus Eisenbacteria bacterium]